MFGNRDSVFCHPSIFLDTLQYSGADCGQSNGRLRVKAGGGTASNQDFFDYVWTTPSGDTIENLSFGTGAPSTTADLETGIYNLTITDELGCNGEFTFDLRNERELIIDTSNFREISCFGANDGSITVAAVDTPSGSSVGTVITELMYPDGSIQIGVQFNNLGPGDYTIIARDDECMSTLDFTLTDPPQFTIADSIIVDESCNADNDGAIALTMAGGTAPYSFMWSNGGMDSVITGLDSGSYSVVVIDANGCSQNFSFDIEKAGIQFAFDTIQNIQCPGSADAIIDLTGVQQNYSFMWSTGSMDKSISGLGPGVYSVTVTDGICSGMDSITLIDPLGLSLASVTLTPPMCARGSDGNIDINIMGGTMPYNYNWSDGSSARTLALVGAGNYSVTVTDANNCPELIIDTVLTDPVSMLLTFTNVDSVSCFTPDVFGPDGGADVLVTNGSPPYDFFWGNGETGATAAMLPQGWNEVAVVDQDGCQMFDSVFIPSPPEIILDLSNTIDSLPTCFGYNDGSIQIAAAGGVPGYTYLWPNPDGSPGTLGPFKDNLTAGTYRVLVRDSKGCRDSLFVTLDQPVPITASIDSINTTGETCHDSNNGRIVINTTGRDSSELIFTWTDDISFNNTAENLDTGLYQVIIEDERGCPGDTLVYFLNSPAPITYSFTGDQQIDCNGETILLNFDGITGGNIPDRL